MLHDGQMRRTLKNHPSNHRWWFIRLQHVSILCQLLLIILLKLQNLVKRWLWDHLFTQHAVEDSLLSNSRLLAEITHLVSIATRTCIQLPCVCNSDCTGWTTSANAWHCAYNTQNFWVNTSWFATVKFRPTLNTLDEVTNTVGLGKCWNLSCISVHTLFLISAYMCTITAWSATYFISNHFKWENWRGEYSTAICRGAEQFSAFSYLSWSPWCAAHDVSWK